MRKSLRDALGPSKRRQKESSKHPAALYCVPTLLRLWHRFKYNDARKPIPAARAPRERGQPLATGEISTSTAQTPPQLPQHKVKIKKAGQRACNEKNEKGKFCGGHLKRWFYTTDVIEQACGDAEKAWGPDAEVYRCEHCQTLYLPNPAEAKVNVAGQGMISVFGLTLPPKEK